MKKLIALLMVLLLTVALVGCGDKSGRRTYYGEVIDITETKIIVDVENMVTHLSFENDGRYIVGDHVWIEYRVNGFAKYSYHIIHTEPKPND